MKFLEEMVPKANSVGNILITYRDGFKDLKSTNEMIAFHRLKLLDYFKKLENSLE